MRQAERCENCGGWIIPDSQGYAAHDCPLVCKNCGHQPCSACLSWCDVIDDEYEACCDGQCEYENYEILWCNEHWRKLYAQAEKEKG